MKTVTLEANRSRMKSEKHVIEVVIKKFICYYKKTPFFFLFFLLFFLGGEVFVVVVVVCLLISAAVVFSLKTGKCFRCKMHISLKWQICASSSANVHLVVSFPGPFYFTSTEARWLIRVRDRGWGGGGRGWKSEGSTVDTAWNRPQRPWTAARTMEVLRRCPLAIAQRLVHRAIAVLTAVPGQSQGQCPLHCCWGTTWSKRSPTFAAQLHLPTHDLFWANLKVQLHLPPLDLMIFWSRLEPWVSPLCFHVA